MSGDKLWGEYGFYDAFNVTEQWWADSYLLAIDQGPIICMIENHRSGVVLWNLFMSLPPKFRWGWISWDLFTENGAIK